MKRRTFLAAGGALALAACAVPTRGDFASAEAPAPQWRAGDRWTFRRTDGFNNLPRGVLTRSVESVDAGGIRFATRTETGILLDEALFESPGVQVYGMLSEDGPVRGSFTPHLRVYDFPLVSGKQWRQSLVRTDANGYRIAISASIRVEGWEDVAAGERSHRALVIRRKFNLGMKDPFTGILHREELEWYAPELRGAARMRVDEYIATRSLRHPWYAGDRFLYALDSYRLA